MEKDYARWHVLAGIIQARNTDSTLQYKERDIWWVYLGYNIGTEENGKGGNFARPVLIVRGFSTHLFWGVPLSTTKRRGIYHYPFVLNSRTSTALLSQMRPFDTKRLIDKMGMINQKDFLEIRRRVAKFLA